MPSLVCKPKIKLKKVRTKEPIQAEVVTFYNIVRKVAIAPKCLEEEGFQYKNIARNQRRLDSYSQSIMGNDLLITRAFSLTR